jgi:hypothetical protein
LLANPKNFAVADSDNCISRFHILHRKDAQVVPECRRSTGASKRIGQRVACCHVGIMLHKAWFSELALRGRPKLDRQSGRSE